MRSFLARIALAALAFACVTTTVADGAAFLPKKGRVFAGVTDNGTLQGFNNFGDATGKHPAVLQTFHPWGNGLHLAYRRWQTAIHDRSR